MYIHTQTRSNKRLHKYYQQHQTEIRTGTNGLVICEAFFASKNGNNVTNTTTPGVKVYTIQKKIHQPFLTLECRLTQNQSVTTHCNRPNSLKTNFMLRHTKNAYIWEGHVYMYICTKIQKIKYKKKQPNSINMVKSHTKHTHTQTHTHTHTKHTHTHTISLSLSLAVLHIIFFNYISLFLFSLGYNIEIT